MARKPSANTDIYSAVSSQAVILNTFVAIFINVALILCSCAAREIERVHRGHMGRKKSRHQLKKRNEGRLLSMFFFFVIQLQRSFRGYYSRKYKHNFYVRKRYIRDLAVKGDEVRVRLEEYNRIVAERELMDQERRTDATFKTHAENLHHLMSTRQIRGVFNPPEEFLNVPTLHDIAVEDHIRGAVKDLLRTRGITKTGLVADLHGSRKIPLKGLKNRLSVQASAPYDAVKTEKQQTLLLHRLLTAAKGTFNCGGKTSILNNSSAPPLCVGDPFVDAWGNPLMRRGVPESQQQFNESAYTRKPLFVTHEDKPFYVRTEGNKSAALPNDLFDVIADAEEFGGAAQRHLGASLRFGLPTSADNRPSEGNGTIPPPPLRTSTVKNARNPA
jgi:hypothetical protein